MTYTWGLIASASRLLLIGRGSQYQDAVAYAYLDWGMGWEGMRGDCDTAVHSTTCDSGWAVLGGRSPAPVRAEHTIRLSGPRQIRSDPPLLIHSARYGW